MTATAPARRGRPPKRNPNYHQASGAKRDTAFRFGDPADKPPTPMPLPGYRPKRKLPVGAHGHISSRNLPISMPTLPDRGITDLSLGLDPSDAAQLKAETYLRAVIAHQLREEAKVRLAARLAA